MNLFEYPVEYILQILGGCLELQVPHIKGFSSSLPLSVEVDCIRHFSKSSFNSLSALSCTSSGSLGTWNFPFARFTDLGFRSDLTGIGDVSVGASVLGLDAESSDVKDETFPSVLIDVSLSWGLLGVAIQTLACWGESK